MGTYAKGYMAAFSAVVTAGMQYSDAFCNTWWPAIIAFAGMVGVVAVPNAKKSDNQRVNG